MPGMENAEKPSRLQDLASRVWYLPHVRLAVFKHLASTIDSRSRHPSDVQREERELLTSLMTIGKEASLDIALLLYPATHFDDFPWKCKDEVSYLLLVHNPH